MVSGWFPKVSVGCRRFQVVCCFSSYTNFTTYRRVISLLYSWTHMIDWGHSIFLLDSKKRIIVALSPSRSDYCDYFLYSIVLFPMVLFPVFYSMSDKKLLSKETKKKKTVTKHKASGVLRIICDEEFWHWASEFFSKTGRLFALTGRWGELNQTGEISPSDSERRQICKIVRYDVFSPSQKLFTAIKKRVCLFIVVFSVVWSI